MAFASGWQGGCLAVVVMSAFSGCAAAGPGVFERRADVGAVAHPGTAVFDAGRRAYTVTGGGANMWGAQDAFCFVWKRAERDLCLETRLRWVGEGVNPHRKAGLIVRRTLEAGSPYVDAVVHGDGLTSMQYRMEAGGDTAEIKAVVNGPARLRLERHGDVFSFEVAEEGKAFEPAGALTVPLGQAVYVGLAVCSHEADLTETAVFTDVRVETPGVVADAARAVESTLEVIDVETGRRRIVYRAREHFEAPNWTTDGRDLIFNSGGRLYRIPVAGGEKQLIDTGFADHCNNDHGLSPDGKTLAISHHQNGASLIYIVPAGGGTPRQVTAKGPSYWHGWSPDGKTLVYCAEREGHYDVYAIGVDGGAERRLTDAEGLDDGPEYSPDGMWIYFNSVRTGVMKIWRMRPDGNGQEQVTSQEEYADWFAHPSPDGKQIVFLSYDKTVEGHPANQDVALRIMPAAGGEARVLTRLFGGQGTINVPSWSPDSRCVAFVSYRLVKP